MFFKQTIAEINSISHSDQFVWELEEENSLASMVFHLRYNLQKYLPFLNNYLSLNDPTSYLHIRNFYHLVCQNFCHPSPIISFRKYILSVRTHSL